MFVVFSNVPPRFDATRWRHKVPPPLLYAGFEDSFRVFAGLVTVDKAASNIAISGRKFQAHNLQMASPAQEQNYPIYFELTGQRYHYVFNVWADCLVIEVWSSQKLELLSAMFPSTPSELERALTTVVADLPS